MGAESLRVSLYLTVDIGEIMFLLFTRRVKFSAVKNRRA